jgi:hypothetical protein
MAVRRSIAVVNDGRGTRLITRVLSIDKYLPRQYYHWQ